MGTVWAGRGGGIWRRGGGKGRGLLGDASCSGMAGSVWREAEQEGGEEVERNVPMLDKSQPVTDLDGRPKRETSRGRALQRRL